MSAEGFHARMTARADALSALVDAARRHLLGDPSDAEMAAALAAFDATRLPAKKRQGE